jgi:hypothetical protein
VAGVAVAAAGAEQVEAGVEPVGEVVDGQGADPGGGELDGQGEAVEGTADVADPGQEPPPGRDPGVGGAGPVQEQPDRGAAHLLGAGRGDLQRRHDQDPLAGGGEPLPAGRQDREPPGRGEQLLGQPGHGGQQVLAVVEHQEPAGPPRPPGERLPQGRARHHLDPGGVGHGVAHGAVVAQRGQVHPPHGVVAVGGLLGQAGLADPARADQRHQRPGGEGLADQRELPLPADERGRPPGPRPPGPVGPVAAVGRDGLQRPPQHLLLEPPQLRRRVEAELVAEPVAVAGEGGERLAGPAGLPEGGDQQGDGPFPPRLPGHDGLERGRGLGDPVQPEQQHRPVLLGGQPELVEAQRLPPGEGRRELGVGRAPPQRERPVQQREPGGGRTAGPGLAEQRGEALGVDGAGGHLEEVAGRPGGDHRPGRPEGLAEPDHVGLERVAGLPRRRLAEDVVDQPVQRDDVAAMEHERRQQRPLPRPRHPDGPSGDPDLERPQDAELDLVRLPGHASIIAPPCQGPRTAGVRRVYAGCRRPGAGCRAGGLTTGPCGREGPWQPPPSWTPARCSPGGWSTG